MIVGVGPGRLKITAAASRLQDRVMSAAGVDHALTQLVDRIVARVAPEHRNAGLPDDACEAMTRLIARNAAARARAGVIESLVRAKRN